MTVSSTTNKVQFSGNGVTTAFSFPYLFFATTDLTVTLYDTVAMAAVSPAPVLNGSATYDYTVTGTYDTDKGEYTSGGTVTFNTAPPTGDTVTIERIVPQTQAVTLIDNSKFPANTVNGALDRLTVLVQRVGQLIGQALYYPSSDPSTVSNILPGYQTRASMFLAFDASGNPIASPGPVAGGTTPLSAFWAATVQLASAALSRVALAVPGLADNNTYTGTNAGLTPSRGDNSTKWATTAFFANALGGVALRSYLSGLGLSNNASPNTKVDVASGVCTDSTNVAMLAYTAGTIDCGTVGANGLDAGVLVLSTWYHAYIIGKTDGTTAALASTSVSSPTLPTGYTLKRRIGSFKTDASVHILVFVQDGDLFQWGTPVLDVADTNPGAALQTKTLASVPTGVNVVAQLIIKPVFGSTQLAIYVHDLALVDLAASETLAPLGAGGSTAASGGVTGGIFKPVRTNTSAQIGYRLSGATGGSDVIRIEVEGWTDRRGRDA